MIKMRGRDDIRGQSLVEFALCLSFLILIFVGVFDLGRAFHAYVVITNAARNGAYYGSMHAQDISGIKQQVINEAQNSGIVLTATNIAVSSTGQSGTPICVTVDYDFPLLLSFFLDKQSMRLESRIEMVIY